MPDGGPNLGQPRLAARGRAHPLKAVGSRSEIVATNHHFRDGSPTVQAGTNNPC